MHWVLLVLLRSTLVILLRVLPTAVVVGMVSKQKVKLKLTELTSTYFRAYRVSI